MEKKKINLLTLKSMPLLISRGSLKCSGTAFLYLHNHAHYLVTAWHNFSGRNFIDKQPVAAGAWLPSHIHLNLPLEYSLDCNQGFEFGSYSFTTRLYSDEDEEDPIWLVHSEQKSRLDIAVIPLSIFANSPSLVNKADQEDLVDIINTLNGASTAKTLSKVQRSAQLLAHEPPNFKSQLEIANDVFVIGFPEAIAAGHGTAIWKRGSIASEPDLPLQDRPGFLIDSATRPGLSGAPVVGRFVNPEINNEDRGVLTLLGNRFGFCGLYSARLGKCVEGAQLGVVWREDAIQEVIANGTIGRPSKDVSGLLSEGAGDTIV